MYLCNLVHRIFSRQYSFSSKDDLVYVEDGERRQQWQDFAKRIHACAPGSVGGLGGSSGDSSSSLMRCSARTGDGVHVIFQTAAELCVRRAREKELLYEEEEGKGEKG